jgi:UDP-N-acetylglucosamine 1-carboxyvinyltransferase
MRITVQGRAALHGDYFPSGNSNAAIAAIGAALLSADPVILRNVPDTISTNRMLDIAQQLGATVTRQDASTIEIQTSYISTRSLEQATTGSFPAGILFVAPIIARRGLVQVEWVGPINRFHTHLTALRDLGLEIEITGNAININAEPWERRELILTETSVTATALVCMLAAALGKTTILHNAASEPHLRTLQQLLVQMGARIEGIGSNLLTIYGFDETPGKADIGIPYDHIEIASIAAIAAITDGQIDIHHVYLPDLRMALKVYERLGMQYFLEAVSGEPETFILHVPQQNGMRVSRRQEDTDVSISTAPWPGFPSDLVALTTVLASQTRGTTLIHEKLFDNRMLFTDRLKSMGANIVMCDPHRAVVIGKSQLRAEYMDTPDIRTGLAILAAALCADGTTVIDNAQLINRTFEGVIPKLTRLGAKIVAEEAIS